MPKTPPDYFNKIKESTQRRWDQLENDPELAGPWNQLFRQIQSTRHVISELLQNADDAEATMASVELQNNIFIFSHNGNDFDEKDFHSICQFGVSKKRSLHTIGFRGIGFKSTFSLGSRVEVYSPSISIYFEKARFTEPFWIKESSDQNDSLTKIKIRIVDKKILEFIQQDINRWIMNPYPLIFFKNIKKLNFNGQNIFKEILSNGPVKNSRWINLVTEKKTKLLLVNSETHEVSMDALHEIREERGDPGFEIPPVDFQAVLGLNQQQIFVVLPTNVVWNLPFSINAPFIQDPARRGIKDPIHSPMNRWLLEKIGLFLTNTFFEWLSNEKININERIKSYSLLPKRNIQGQGFVEEFCEEIISQAFEKALINKNVLLSEEEKLESKENCLDLPSDIIDIWKINELLSIFGEEKTAILSRYLSSTDKNLLDEWDLLQRTSASDILERLSRNPLPPNPGIEKIVLLWKFVHKHYQSWSNSYYRTNDLRVIPAKGKKYLYSSNKVNVLGAKEKQLSDEEFDFLQDHLIILDPSWKKFVESIEEKAEKNKVDNDIIAIVELFSRFDLDRGVTIETIFKIVSEEVFSGDDPSMKGIRLAHIASRLGIPVPSGFQYFCRDGRWREVSKGVLMPDEALLADLFPEDLLKSLCISEEYDRSGVQAEVSQWQTWLKSSKSGLRKFLLPTEFVTEIYGRQGVQNYCLKKNGTPPKEYPYKSQKFEATDFDFPKNHWQFWRDQQGLNPKVWCELVYQIMQDWSTDWEKCTKAEIEQKTTYYKYHLNHSLLPASWVEELKKRKCLPDSFSNPRFPSELYRSTKDTSMLGNIEPFVHEDYDKPDFHRFLDLLGVLNKPTDAKKIIERIQAISKSDVKDSTFRELVNLYNALDRILLRLDPDDLEEARLIFTTEPLVLSTDNTWHTSSTIYQFNTNNIPGLPMIGLAFNDLNLWDKLNVTKHPTMSDAINWLKQLDSGNQLDKEVYDRVIAILGQIPERVWSECNHWINLKGDWQPTNGISWYAETSTNRYNLYDWVKEATADFSFLENHQPISSNADISLIDLAIQNRLDSYNLSRYTANPDWISSVAHNLLEVREERNAKSIRKSLNRENIIENSMRLAETRLMYVNSLQVTPYIDNQPVGFRTNMKALWGNLFLYVYDDGNSSYKAIVNTVSSFFQDQVIRDAVEACVDRSRDWIDLYFKTYFILEEINKTDPNSQEKDPEGEPEEIEKSPETLEPPVGPSDPDEDESVNEGDGKPTPPEPKPKPRKKVLRPEEKFAVFIQKSGFSWNSDNKMFTNENGHKILMEKSIFPWVEYDSEGNETTRYLIEEGSLAKGLIIDAEVIYIMQESPESFCLIIDDEKSFQKLFWKDIDKLLKNNQLTYSPASFLFKVNKS